MILGRQPQVSIVRHLQRQCHGDIMGILARSQRTINRNCRQRRSFLRPRFHGRHCGRGYAHTFWSRSMQVIVMQKYDYPSLASIYFHHYLDRTTRHATNKKQLTTWYKKSFCCLPCLLDAFGWASYYNVSYRSLEPPVNNHHLAVPKRNLVLTLRRLFQQWRSLVQEPQTTWSQQPCDIASVCNKHGSPLLISFDITMVEKQQSWMLTWLLREKCKHQIQSWNLGIAWLPTSVMFSKSSIYTLIVSYKLQSFTMPASGVQLVGRWDSRIGPWPPSEEQTIATGKKHRPQAHTSAGGGSYWGLTNSIKPLMPLMPRYNYSPPNSI